jgi:hypothetical protein
MEQQETTTRLTPPWLWLAHIAWWLLLLTGVVRFIRLIPVNLAAYRQLCDQPTEICAQIGLPLSAELVETLATYGISLATYRLVALGLPFLSTIIWLLVGLLIYWRKRDDWMALLTSLLLMLTGLALGSIAGVNDASPTWTFTGHFFNTFPFLLFAIFFALFPNGRFVPRFFRLLLPIWLVLLLIPWTRLGLTPTLATLFDALVWFPFWFGGILAQWYRYRITSTPIERSQTRWVMFGLGVVAVGLAINIILSESNPTWALILRYSNWLSLIFTAVPVSIGIAILRYRLWDIDVLIRKTLVYGILTTLLALFFSGGVVLLQRLFIIVTGEGSELAVVASTLAIAALFTPLRRRIQRSIDRRFYRRQYDAVQTLAHFADVARNETDLEQLTAQLLHVIDDTMQPVSVGLWLRPDQAQPER